ncbi:MAG TPA: hypothetical protein VHB02_08185 [Acidimicrobiales bacterium]|nr:hypothetical protein [Acidimicrobiales bacterium]
MIGWEDGVTLQREGTADVLTGIDRLASHGIERLEQFYTRSDDHDRLTFVYEAPAFGFQCRLVYDAAGPLLDYPGIAVREDRSWPDGFAWRDHGRWNACR